MSASRRPTLLSRGAILVVLACASLAGCGDSSNSKLLSPASATKMRATLAQVEQQVQNGNCAGAQAQVSILDEQISSLNRIEADLRDALVSGASRLQQLVTEKCQVATTTEGTTGEAGTPDTGGTGSDEDANKPGKSEDKGKKKKEEKKKKGEQPSVEIVPDTGTGGAGDSGGTTDSGGVVP